MENLGAKVECGRRGHHRPGHICSHRCARARSSPGASHTAAGARAYRAGLSIRGLPTNAVTVPVKGRPVASTSTAPSANAPTPTIPRAILAPAAGTGTPTRLGPDKSGVGAPPAAFAASAPVVSSLSPATGPQGGGNWVTVRGGDLSGASAVYSAVCLPPG